MDEIQIGQIGPIGSELTFLEQCGCLPYPFHLWPFVLIHAEPFHLVCAACFCNVIINYWGWNAKRPPNQLSQSKSSQSKSRSQSELDSSLSALPSQPSSQIQKVSWALDPTEPHLQHPPAMIWDCPELGPLLQSTCEPSTEWPGGVSPYAGETLPHHCRWAPCWRQRTLINNEAKQAVTVWGDWRAAIEHSTVDRIHPLNDARKNWKNNLQKSLGHDLLNNLLKLILEDTWHTCASICPM